MPPTKQPCPAGSTESVATTRDGRGGGLPARSHDGAAARIRPFLLLRYTLVAATAYLILAEDRFAIPSVGIGVAIAAALASNVAVSLLPAWVIGSKYFGAALVIGDTAWITSALLASGRFDADFVFLYFFVILLAAMGESLWLIVLGAVVVCIAYIYVMAATGTGLVDVELAVDHPHPLPVHGRGLLRQHGRPHAPGEARRLGGAGHGAGTG
jgi:hypothetical protein